MKAIGYHQVFTDVPSGSIDHQQDLLVRTRPDLLGKGGQGLIEPSAIRLRQNEPFGIASCGMNKAVEVRPLVARINQGQWSLPHFGPNLANNRFQPQAMLIKGPSLDKRFGVLLLEFSLAFREFF